MHPLNYDAMISAEVGVTPDAETAPADYWRARFRDQREQLCFIMNGSPIEGTEGYKQNMTRYNALIPRRYDIFIGTLGSGAIAACYEN